MSNAKGVDGYQFMVDKVHIPGDFVCGESVRISRDHDHLSSKSSKHKLIPAVDLGMSMRMLERIVANRPNALTLATLFYQNMYLLHHKLIPVVDLGMSMRMLY